MNASRPLPPSPPRPSAACACGRLRRASRALTQFYDAAMAASAPRAAAATTAASGRRGLFSRSFVLLLAATLFSAFAWLVGRLGLFMAMGQLGFAATAISLSTAVGGIISLPAPLVLGWLSDRMGRRRLMLGCYAAGVASLIVLAWATGLAAFWCAAALNSILYVSTALASALVTDLAPRRPAVGLQRQGAAEAAVGHGRQTRRLVRREPLACGQQPLDRGAGQGVKADALAAGHDGGQEIADLTGGED